MHKPDHQYPFSTFDEDNITESLPKPEFCMTLDSFLIERTRLTMLKEATRYSDTLSRVFHFVFKRALVKNLKQIQSHGDGWPGCSLCEMKGQLDPEPACNAIDRLVQRQLSLIQIMVRNSLQSEGLLPRIENGTESK
jgi:hypothetical protein